MSAQLILFPPVARKTRSGKSSNRDLIGRSYREGHTRVTVIALCGQNDARVMVRRMPGGEPFSMPGWLMRFALMDNGSQKKRKRVA
jgi:hypothetical protein